jgi:hypothetical protein
LAGPAVTTDVGPRSKRKREHQPAEHHGPGDKAGEHHRAETELRASIVPQQGRKHDRDEEREKDQKKEMRVHGEARFSAAYLRPLAMSQASQTTSRFSSPATMTKVLPYS